VCLPCATPRPHEFDSLPITDSPILRANKACARRRAGAARAFLPDPGSRRKATVCSRGLAAPACPALALLGPSPEQITGPRRSRSARRSARRPRSYLSEGSRYLGTVTTGRSERVYAVREAVLLQALSHGAVTRRQRKDLGPHGIAPGGVKKIMA